MCRKSGKSYEYLVLKRHSRLYDKTWQMVSGKVEKGETAWQTALREIREETGIMPIRLFSADCVEVFYEHNQNCVNVIPVFLAFAPEDCDVTLNPEEHSECRWVTFDEAVEILHFDVQRKNLAYIEEHFIQREPNHLLEIKI
ncbi:MAG: NUDIX domain-containing protein [Thermoplasmata archaeon]|nr:NUDIX domain-containing protein [Thermoplasmata archaeon]